MLSLRLSLVLVLASSAAYAQDAAPPEESTPPAETAATEVPPPTPPPVPIQAVVPESGPLPLEFHGYVSQGYVLSDHNNYFQSNSNRGSARLTDAALNATAQITDRLRIVMQVAAVLNDFTPAPQLRIDFGFADYHLSDQLGIRVGRYRFLTSLYSEVWDTDIARVPIFLPSSLYDPSGRQIYLSANGIELYGLLNGDSAGQLNYVLEGGVLDSYTLNGHTQDMAWVANGRLIYDTPLPGLRFGGSYTRIGANSLNPLDATTTQQVIAAGLVPPKFDGVVDLHYHNLWAAKGFIEWQLAKLTLAGEYSMVQGTLVSEFPALAKDFLVRTQGFYGLATYRFTDWFTLGGYASFYYPTATHRSATDPTLHTFDYALTTRFDLNSYLAFKLEGHRIDGTSQLVTNLNPDAISPKGWLFAARISAAF